jgi:hypothetical protein
VKLFLEQVKAEGVWGSTEKLFLEQLVPVKAEGVWGSTEKLFLEQLVSGTSLE